MNRPLQLPDANCWQFPNCLYGKGPVVERAWRRKLRACWNARSWEALFAEPTVDVRESSGMILIGAIRPPTLFQDPMWRLYPIHYEAQVLFEGSEWEGQTEFADWWLEPMERSLWFALGMACSQGPPRPSSAESTERRRSYRKELIRRVVYWLPECLELQHRLGMDAVGTIRPGGAQPSFWWGCIVKGLMYLDVLDKETIRALQDAAGGPLQCLLNAGLIRREGDRYDLGF